ncbi:S26 family signal peptidase [Helicobacter enhydrae]|uniref:Signal peptidase I n=1 Tax=Helicobacter enhydrae TaxID=222136 RepID=A0A1B1U3T4_9HELI|nr:signal peptidase I [Helicobacter enhydrae]ANV97437.1 S26 family signal peptidase [Helicobacter enhydrae]
MEFLYRFYRFASSWTGTIVIVAFVIFFVAQAFVIPTRSMVGTLYEGDMLFVKKFSYGIPIPRIPWLEIPIVPDFNGNGHLVSGERPQRGDVVVFIPPHEERTYYVKRNFAVGGDEVVYAKDGFYLRPNEGDAYIAKHFPNAETKEFFGKTYVKNPYMREHYGIHYASNNALFTQAVNALSFEGQKWVIVGTCVNPKTKELYECKQDFAMQPLRVDEVPIRSSTLYNAGEVVFYKKVPQDEFFMVGDNRDNSLDSRYWGSVKYANVIGKPWLVYFSINLVNSQEARAEAMRQGKDEGWWKYSVRWNRVFITMSGIERDLEKEAQKSGQH